VQIQSNVVNTCELSEEQSYKKDNLIKKFMCIIISKFTCDNSYVTLDQSFSVVNFQIS